MPKKPQIERQTTQWPKEKRKQHSTIYKTVNKKLKIGQYEPN